MVNLVNLIPSCFVSWDKNLKSRYKRYVFFYFKLLDPLILKCKQGENIFNFLKDIILFKLLGPMKLKKPPEGKLFNFYVFCTHRHDDTLKSLNVVLNVTWPLIWACVHSASSFGIPTVGPEALEPVFVHIIPYALTLGQIATTGSSYSNVAISIER